MTERKMKIGKKRMRDIWQQRRIITEPEASAYFLYDIDPPHNGRCVNEREYPDGRSNHCFFMCTRYPADRWHLKQNPFFTVIISHTRSKHHNRPWQEPETSC